MKKILLITLLIIMTTSNWVFAQVDINIGDMPDQYTKMIEEEKIGSDKSNKDGVATSVSKLQQEEIHNALSNNFILEWEPNDSIDLADKIELGSYVYGTITDYYFDLDYFELKIENFGTLEVTGMLGYDGIFSDYLSIALTDLLGNIIGWCDYTGPGFNLQHGVFVLEPGIYYIVVFQSSPYEYLLVNEEYLFSTHFSSVSGWVYLSGNWYYIDKYGDVKTGWFKDGGEWYYLDKSSGVMQTGWTKVGGKWYYMNSSGAMQTGWVKDSGKWYYLSSSGAMETSWTKVGSKWYYMNSSGAMQIGWHKIDGKWYYMNSSGAMETGWTKVGGKWYYINSSGVMQTGWVKDSGKWYYLSSSGAMETGWTKVGSKWYYMNSGGVMQSGWIKVGSKWYYLYSDGSMAANTKIGGYKLGKDGAMI